MFDSDIHDIQMEISRLQQHKRMLSDCQRELKNYGLTGMDSYHLSDEYEYMDDVENVYLELFKKIYMRGW